MFRRLAVVFLTLIPAAVFGADIHGTWHAVFEGDRAQLTVVRDHSTWGHSAPRADFSGLTDEQINATSETPVRFAIRHDAGNIEFNGLFQKSEGVGHFNFVPNRSYGAMLRGVSVDAGDLSDERLFSLAMNNVSIDFIKEMQSLGYREDLERYSAFRIHGVSPQLVRDFRALGYNDLSSEQLLKFRIHGVSPQFVRDLRDLGYKDLSSEQLVTFRIHGVSSAYIRELRDLGYSDVSAEQLVRMRIHGVTTSFIRDVQNAGYKMPVEKLIEMRIHGINAAMLSHQ